MDPTWLSALAGGALIGAAASVLLLFAGQTAGVSGILAAVARPVPKPDRSVWRWLFLGGLVAGGLAMRQLTPQVFGAPIRSVTLLLVGGFLVGLGTRISGGCTSGHGVCGLSRLSGRSLVATITFIAAGVVTVWVLGPGGVR